MSAHPAILDRLRAGGWRVGLGIKIEGERPPPPDLLAELQAQREAVLAALIEEAQRPPLDLVAEALAAFPGSEVRGEAEPIEATVLRWLAGGATVERQGEGFLLTHPDEGRSLAIAPAGLRSLPAWLQQRLVDDAAERAAIRAERPSAWSGESDLPKPGDWCAHCAGRRWWRPAAESRLDPGWRCAVCHPAPPGVRVEEVVT